jgi:hypothetical protein
MGGPGRTARREGFYGEKEASASFFAKKETKKLCPVGFGVAVANARRKQKFFGSFFQKRTAFLRL